MSQLYTVTLTQKIVFDIDAVNPEEALKQAQEKVDGRKFEAERWSVKEVDE